MRFIAVAIVCLASTHMGCEAEQKPPPAPCRNCHRSPPVGDPLPGGKDQDGGDEQEESGDDALDGADEPWLDACVGWHKAHCERVRACFPDALGCDSTATMKDECRTDALESNCTQPSRVSFEECARRDGTDACNDLCPDGFCFSFCFFACND